MKPAGMLAVARSKAALLALLVTSTTFAEPAPPAAFSWVVTPGIQDCPSMESLHQKLAERMGGDPFLAPNAPRFVVQVSQADGKYQAEIRTVAGAATTARSIGGDARSCGEIAEAVVLSLSLLLEANRDVPAPSQPEAGSSSG
jgi:hypothetical protein